MQFWFLFLLLIPATLSSLTFYIFYRDEGTYDLVGIYTLASALFIVVFSVAYVLYAYWYERKYSYFDFDIDCPTITFICAFLSWTIFSLVVLYTSAQFFPPASSYGGFTIFYIILFSLGIFGLLILLLNLHSQAYIMYRVLITYFMTPLLSICVAIFVSTNGVYSSYSFFTGNMVLAVIGTFMAFLAGGYVHGYYWNDEIATRKAAYKLLLMEGIGGIFFPLVPSAVLFNFILLMLKENLFQGDTRTFASLAVINVYFLGIAGLAGMACHLYFDVALNRVSIQQYLCGVRLGYAWPLFQSILQIFVLFGYYSFSEDNPGLYSDWASQSVLLFILLDFFIGMITIMNIRSAFEYNKFLKKVRRDLIIQEVFVIVGAILTSVLLGLEQKQSNVFYSSPQLSLFLLLSILYLAHKSYALLPAQKIFLTELAEQQSFQVMYRARSQHFQPLREEFDISNALQVVSDIPQQLRDQQCAICLSGLYKGTFFEENGFNLEISKIKKCGHYFHTNCISGWLTSRHNCPLDRRAA